MPQSLPEYISDIHQPYPESGVLKRVKPRTDQSSLSLEPNYASFSADKTALLSQFA
jgi:hypothetical protein